MGFLTRELLIAAGAASLAVGCTNIAGLPGTDAALAPLVSSKATDVAEQIGGERGFGGTMMDGYLAHGGPGMGFATIDDLADPDGVVTIQLVNQTAQNATFHLAYFAGHLSLDDQLSDVAVPADSETTLDIPCSDIVGLGDLNMPGAMGCHLEDGDEVGNTFAVPMFFGLDFACGDTINFTLTEDADDLDQDGDVDEPVLLSDGFLMHLEDGGPTGHQHGDGGGMMGTHMGQ
ncbi:MAG: hypothetical protein AAB341_03800 [Planctomycetota bacterium]